MAAPIRRQHVNLHRIGVTTAPTLTLVQDTGSPGDGITKNPAISYSTPAPGDHLLYKVDGGSFSATMPVFATDHSADGAYTVSVEEVDSVGHTSAISSLSFTLDTTVPTETFVIKPALVTNSTSATFSYTATDPIAGGIASGVAYQEASLDGAGFAQVTGSTSLTGLSDGAHTFAVRAVDVAGNVGVAVSYGWTVDTIAPGAPTIVLTHDTGTPNDLVTSNPSLSYGPIDSSDTLIYSTDGTHYFNTAPVFATDGSADGTQTVSVKEVDVAGNVGAAASLTFTLDTTAPARPALALAHDTGASHTDNITSDPTMSVTPAESGGTPFYKMDGAGGFSATAPHFATDGSVDGLHTVSVEQEDAAGNVSAATSLTFTLDTTTPHVTGITASPGSGGVFAGSTIALTAGFNEAVTVTGGTPALALERRWHRRLTTPRIWATALARGFFQACIRLSGIGVRVHDAFAGGHRPRCTRRDRQRSRRQSRRSRQRRGRIQRAVNQRDHRAGPHDRRSNHAGAPTGLFRPHHPRRRRSRGRGYLWLQAPLRRLAAIDALPASRGLPRRV